VRIEGLDANALASLLQAVLPQVERDVQRGALVSIDTGSVRVRALPVR
jgi:hypothetical protein